MGVSVSFLKCHYSFVGEKKIYESTNWYSPKKLRGKMLIELQLHPHFRKKSAVGYRGLGFHNIYLLIYKTKKKVNCVLVPVQFCCCEIQQHAAYFSILVWPVPFFIAWGHATPTKKKKKWGVEFPQLLFLSSGCTP